MRDHDGMYVALKLLSCNWQVELRGQRKEVSFMRVKDVMTPDVKAIWLTESLADAAQLMWDNDCGILPVIKDGRKVIGVITDRDICMAMAMRDTNPSSVSVEEVMTGEVYAVTAEHDVKQALSLMQEHKVRRLPVLDAEGELEGMLSMNDVVLNATASAGPTGRIRYSEIVKTFQAICAHSRPAAKTAKAAG